VLAAAASGHRPDFRSVTPDRAPEAEMTALMSAIRIQIDRAFLMHAMIAKPAPDGRTNNEAKT
jgi:hypothetical protein